MLNQPLKKDVWKRFVTEGVLDTNRINNRIEESWYHCRHAIVNPFDGVGKTILTQNELMKQKQKNQLLIESAIPSLQKLNQLMSPSQAITLLIDREGYVLKMLGDGPTISKAKTINFTEGVQ
ncbi:hypothetical protein LC040_01730 [Bacillus tianshenii]|nr:hypothetical protein LC040_01730 [Bacillus tianshenii]